MKILNIKNDSYIKYLYEYAKICKQTWSNNISDENLDVYVQNKVNKILTNDKVITIEAIIVNNERLGLFLFSNMTVMKKEVLRHGLQHYL